MCRGTTAETRGTAYVVYEELADAKTACEHLSGFNMQGRYLIVLYYHAAKMARKRELDKQQAELDEWRSRLDATEAAPGRPL